MREIVAEDEPFVREEYDFDHGPGAVRGPAVQAGDHPQRQLGGGGGGRRRRGHRRRHGRGLQEPARRRQRRVRRPLSRPARAVDRQARRVQAHEGRRRVLARRREAPDAPADLRHRVGERQGAQGAPPPARGSRAARPPQARRGARPVLVPRGDRLRARGLPPEGRHGPPDHGGVLAAAPHRARATTSSNSPHITKSDLFEESGHLDWYADGMYPPMELDGGTDYYLKPMNCPFHILIYESHTRSYRDLPMRYFEFGSVYRYEKSGVVHGLTRVRGMTQDDAHIFTTKELMVDEIESLLELRARRAARLRARRLLPGALDQARAEGRRHRRGVGRGDRGVARGRVEDRPRARDGRGRRRVLRPEDLGAGP